MDKIEKLEIKINALNHKIDNLLMIMIKIHDLDQDLIKSNHDHSDQDHDQDLSDQDLISWICSILPDHGINPGNRDFNSCIRSIRYYRRKYDQIKNHVKYISSFLPPVKVPVVSSSNTDDDLIDGFKPAYLEKHMHLVTIDIVQDIISRNTKRYNTLKLNAESVMLQPGWLRYFTGQAFKLGLIKEISS